jgi:hypothetical protein
LSFFLNAGPNGDFPTLLPQEGDFIYILPHLPAIRKDGMFNDANNSTHCPIPARGGHDVRGTCLTAGSHSTFRASTSPIPKRSRVKERKVPPPGGSHQTGESAASGGLIGTAFLGGVMQSLGQVDPSSRHRQPETIVTQHREHVERRRTFISGEPESSWPPDRRNSSPSSLAEDQRFPGSFSKLQADCLEVAGHVVVQPARSRCGVVNNMVE